MIKKELRKRLAKDLPYANSYKRAYEDIELLNKPPLRSVRVQLELLKPDLYLLSKDINETVVCFGSARVWPEKEAKSRLEKAQKEYEAGKIEQIEYLLIYWFIKQKNSDYQTILDTLKKIIEV